jgi:hypothetical protein
VDHPGNCIQIRHATPGKSHRIANGDPSEPRRHQLVGRLCCRRTPELIERERRSIPATVFQREYMNQFDSVESRFFDVNSIDAAFGSVIGPTPEVVDGSRLVAQGASG